MARETITRTELLRALDRIAADATIYDFSSAILQLGREISARDSELYSAFQRMTLRVTERHVAQLEERIRQNRVRRARPPD
jgi:hypothetical protein